VQGADLVFEGEVLSCDVPYGQIAWVRVKRTAARLVGTSMPTVEDYNRSRSRYRFRVLRGWKGVSGTELVVTTPRDGGYGFETGGRYLVYGNQIGDRTMTGFCMRTRPLADAEEDLAYLLLREAQR
jgi:hypothetical protein